MTTAALILVALCVLGGAALLDVVAGTRHRSFRTIPYLGLAVAAVFLAVAGFRADLGHGATLNLGTVLGFGHSALRADPLAGLFLALTGVIATPIALVFVSWAREETEVPHRGLAAAASVTVAAVTVIVLADNAYVFLFGWEALSVAFYMLAGYRRERPGAVTASMLTFGFSKASGALLLLAFSLLYGATGTFNLGGWDHVAGATHGAAFALAIAGFAIKVGVVPVHVWMPTGYGAAPGPARALMSAVAANVGFYGMWRTFAILGTPPTWLAIVLVLAAALTALLGIAHAAVQGDLQRLIAYSSVENGGLITAGFAIGLAGAAAHQPKLAALGILTSSLQMVAHSFAKSSLFLSSAVIEQAAGTRDLDRLRGVGADVPWAGVAFSVGAFTLAGLPLTLGFVSEWYLLESVMQLFRIGSLTLAMSLALAGALIALAVGLAGFTFVRLVSLTILGRRRRDRESPLHGSIGMLGRVGLLVPAIGCVGVAVVSPWEIRFLIQGLSPVVGTSATSGALQAPWVLQPVYADFSALSPSWLSVEMPLLAITVLIVVTVASRGSFLAVRRVPAWRSATGGVAGDARYTSFAFANATRHVLANLLMTRSGVSRLDADVESSTDGEFAGPDMPGVDEPDRTDHPEVSIDGRSGRACEASDLGPADGLVAFEGADAPGSLYSTDVVEVVGAFIYRPLLLPLLRTVAMAKRLQSGRLDAYIGYMLIVLVALIAVVVGLS